MSDQPTFGGTTHSGYVPGQIVLRVHEGAVRPYVAAGGAEMSVESARRLPENVVEPLELLRREAGATSVRPIFTSRQVRRRVSSRTSSRGGGRALRSRELQNLAVIASVAESDSEELSGLTVVEVSKRDVPAELLRRVASSPAVDFAEPMPARWLTAVQQDDPVLNRQWGHRAIHWFEANRPDASDIVVGVLDTGVDVNHPDLSADIDYHHDGLSSRDLIGHGTHVSGIIAAKTNTVAGISGVANCKLAVFKVFPDEPASDGQFYVDGDRYLRALNSVIEAGAKVVNLSLGGPNPSQAEQLLFNRLARVGIVVVAAMGNEYEAGNPTEYPGAYDNVFAVGATAETDLRASYSNTGRHIQITAPGSNILSTLPTARSEHRAATYYDAWSGTSMATPHVAGAAALLAAKHPGWGPAEIEDRLIKTAGRPEGMGKSAWTEAYGHGLLDLEVALS